MSVNHNILIVQNLVVIGTTYNVGKAPIALVYFSIMNWGKQLVACKQIPAYLIKIVKYFFNIIEMIVTIFIIII